MSEPVVLVPLADGRWLGLSHDQLVAALDLGSTLMPPVVPHGASSATPPRLLSAAEMQAATGVPSSWFERQARERRIPATKIGKYWRFELEQVVATGAKPRLGVLRQVNGGTGQSNRCHRQSSITSGTYE